VVAVVARHLHRLAIAHDLEREVMPRPAEVEEVEEVVVVERRRREWMWR
jgi:hypothetical protein